MGGIIETTATEVVIDDNVEKIASAWLSWATKIHGVTLMRRGARKTALVWEGFASWEGEEKDGDAGSWLESVIAVRLVEVAAEDAKGRRMKYECHAFGEGPKDVSGNVDRSRMPRLACPSVQFLVDEPLAPISRDQEITATLRETKEVVKFLHGALGTNVGHLNTVVDKIVQIAMRLSESLTTNEAARLQYDAQRDAKRDEMTLELERIRSNAGTSKARWEFFAGFSQQFAPGLFALLSSMFPGSGFDGFAGGAASGSKPTEDEIKSVLADVDAGLCELAINVMREEPGEKRDAMAAEFRRRWQSLLQPQQIGIMMGMQKLGPERAAAITMWLRTERML